MIFEIKDRSQRMLRLTKERWKHIAQEHSEINVEWLKETLVDPLVIIPSVHDMRTKWYYRLYKERKRYLLVAVKYLNGHGFIITAYFTKRI